MLTYVMQDIEAQDERIILIGNSRFNRVAPLMNRKE
jgi:hypothetical protein